MQQQHQTHSSQLRRISTILITFSVTYHHIVLPHREHPPNQHPEKDPQPEEPLQDTHPPTCPGQRRDVNVSCPMPASTDLQAWAGHQASPDHSPGPIVLVQPTACHNLPNPILLRMEI